MTDQETQTTGECAAPIQEPGEAHKRLDPFVGTFDAKVKMWMGPGDPMESTGTMINRLELGGRFLRQQFRGDESGGPFPNFEGQGYWGYNMATGKYEGFWIDTASTAMQTEQGDVDGSGKVWSMSGQTVDPTGKAVTKRSVITLEDRNRHTLEMYFTLPDGNEAKCMEIQYTRKT